MIKTTNISGFPSGIKRISRSDLRKAVMTILLRDLSKVKCKRILEVGCGNWDFTKKILEKNNCEWFGVEPVDMGNQNLTLVKGSVKNIPYHDESFDIVLCNQTMEHWFEYNVSLKKALSEIHRVLKPGGILMINSPIHLHGDPRFLSGELGKIKSAFKKKLWKIVLFEKCFPPKKIQGWKRISSRGFFSKIGYPDFMIPNPKEASNYVINIHARKKVTGRKKQRLKLPSRDLIVLFRFIKTYIKTRFFF